MLIPLSISSFGIYLKIDFHKIVWTILIFYLFSRTFDWYIAPGTHDSTGIGWMILMSIFATFVMIGIWAHFFLSKNLNSIKKKTYLTLILILIIPTLHILFMIKFCNQNFNKTNKTLMEYFESE